MAALSPTRLWRRLDIRLSSILFGIIAAWGVTFLLSLHWVQKERARRSVETERERIRATVDHEMRSILGAIVLDHQEALQLTLQAIVRNLGLGSADLVLTDGRKFHEDGAVEGSGHLLEEAFPVGQDSREFGSLVVRRTVALAPYASGPVVFWVVALVAIQGLFFWIIRRFFRHQVIDPIRRVIAAPSTSGAREAGGASEIEELNRLFLSLREQNERYQSRLLETEKREALAKIASQVSHDIRSPLSALEELLPALTKLPEQERVLARRAIGRIRDIAYTLLARSREAVPTAPVASSDIGVELVPPLVEAMVSEKRLQYQARVHVEVGAAIDASAYDAFVVARDFPRVLSNLVDNAIEALGERGRVVVSVACPDPERVEISVSDDGRGIPPEILEKLRGGVRVTHGKPNGHGLGLGFVRERVEEWGARMSIQSIVGTGTLVRLALPRAAAPAWFLSVLDLRAATEVAILDDDPSVHQVWNNKLAPVRVTLHHFTTAVALRAWLGARGSGATGVRFLLDYELIGSADNGLDLASELRIADRTVLVTSRFDEPAVRAGGVRSGVRLVPKPLVAHLPILSDGAERPTPVDVVLIDDDELVRLSWQLWAQRAGSRLACFPSVNAFLGAAARIPREAPVYIDLNLGDGPRGDLLARALFDKGFRNLYLATGEAPGDVEARPWIRAVVGKAPPYAALAADR